ncbi:Histone acetyltransferase [Zalaria obscura]|uniref:Histone acetyltransferase n=1 Tax=Zalaria obscura TaxID=2024903 RepID=A0ACC3SLM9_9PEZI
MAPTTKTGADGEKEAKVEKGFATLATLRVGVKAWVEKEGEKRKAEILSIQTRKGKPTFYVHYEDFNKRLDEWVPAERLDLSREVDWPLPEKPESKTKKAATSKATSKANTSKNSKANKRPRTSSVREVSATPTDLSETSRRPSQAGGKENQSPSVSVLAQEPADGTPQADVDGDEDTVDLLDMQDQAAAAKAMPDHEYSREEEIEKLRTGGSMTQNQTEISRVRNLERVQMGQHEIEPWYFSPYPVEFIPATPAQMHAHAPARKRDLPRRLRFVLRDRRPAAEDVVSESLSAEQTIPGPQNALLRRRSVPVLLHDFARRARAPSRRLLQQGKGVGRGLQRRVYPDPPAIPTQRVRKTADRVQLRAQQARRQARVARKATVRSRAAGLPGVLARDDRGPADGNEGGDQRGGGRGGDGDDDQRRAAHAAESEHAPVLGEWACFFVVCGFFSRHRVGGSEGRGKVADEWLRAEKSPCHRPYRCDC